MDTELTNNKLQTGNRLEITEGMKENLLCATKWIRFMNVVGCISIGILAFIGLVLDLASRYTFMGLFYIAMCAIYAPVLSKVFTFIRQARNSCRNNDNGELDGMFDSMRYISKYMGILCVIVLCIYALAIAFGIIAIVVLSSLG